MPIREAQFLIQNSGDAQNGVLPEKIKKKLAYVPQRRQSWFSQSVVHKGNFSRLR